jgi:hypothetical protein
MTKAEKLIELREKIPFNEQKVNSPIELFQHKVLRPILKFSNETINKLTLNYLIKLNPTFNSLNVKKKEEFILISLKKEQTLKNKLNGIIIGLLTDIELEFYLENSLLIDERIQQMIQERVKTQFKNYLSNNNSPFD